MIKFIKPNEIPSYPKDSIKVDEDKINEFITKFNQYIITRGLGNYNVGVNYVMNDFINNLPILNLSEFAEARLLAKDAGWNLTFKKGNFYSTSYYMSFVNNN